VKTTVISAGLMVLAIGWHASGAVETHGRGGGLSPYRDVASSPAVDENTGAVFIGTQGITAAGHVTGDGRVLMLDGSTGAVAHSVTVRHFPWAIITDAADNRVMVGAAGCPQRGGACPSEAPTVSVLDARAGAVVRTVGGVELTPLHSGSLLVAKPTPRVLVLGCDKDGVRALDVMNGRLLNSTALQGCATAAVADESVGRVIVGSGVVNLQTFAMTSMVSFVRVSDGKVLHTESIYQFLNPAVIDERRHRAFFLGTIPRGEIHGQPTIRVVDTRTGAMLQIVTLGFQSQPFVLAVDSRAGRVFIDSGGGDNTVYMLDAATGQLLRRVVIAADAGGRILQTLVDEPSGHVLTMNGATDGITGSVTMAVLDAKQGTVLHTTRLGVIAGYMALDGRTERAFIFSQDNATVSILDARTGSHLSTVSLGKPIVEESPPDVRVAVDIRTSRVFVIHHYDGTLSVLDARTGAVLHTLALR